MHWLAAYTADDESCIDVVETFRVENYCGFIFFKLLSLSGRIFVKHIFSGIIIVFHLCHDLPGLELVLPVVSGVITVDVFLVTGSVMSKMIVETEAMSL